MGIYELFGSIIPVWKVRKETGQNLEETFHACNHAPDADARLERPEVRDIVYWKGVQRFCDRRTTRYCTALRVLSFRHVFEGRRELSEEDTT